MATYSELTVVAGTVITEEWGNDVRDSAVSVHASATARDSAITSPTEGMTVYLSDSDSLCVYDGSNWLFVDVELITGTIFTAETGFSIEAEEGYWIGLRKEVFITAQIKRTGSNITASGGDITNTTAAQVAAAYRPLSREIGNGNTGSIDIGYGIYESGPLILFTASATIATNDVMYMSARYPVSAVT